jgi:hypothetical protein
MSLNSPKDVFRHSFASGDIVTMKKFGYRLLNDRDLTFHTHNEPLVCQFFAHLPEYSDILK